MNYGGGIGIHCRNELQVDSDMWNKTALIYGNLIEAIEQINTSMNQIPGFKKYELLVISDFNFDNGAKRHPSAGYMKPFAAED